MKYKLTTPCKTCPFRRSTFFSFPEERIDEILNSQGGFACHKTTTELGRSTMHKEAQSCAGRLITLERSGESDQMMRIAERLGLYDRTKLDMENEDVFESVEEFIEVRCE